MTFVPRSAVLLFALILCGGEVHADQLSLFGFADLRLIVPSREKSWLDGGLGKFRYGQDNVQISVSEVVAEGKLQLVPDLSLRAMVRYAPDQKTAFDIIESYTKYLSIFSDEWRFSAKAGAFFPPISLENEAIGWSSPWTISSSAINSWVGDELRTIGIEPRIERRIGAITIEASAAVFGWNDPAGILIAKHGWTFNDRPAGLLDTARLPDYTAVRSRLTPPQYTGLFREIDDSPGWYAEASAQEENIGRVTVLRYDNRSNPKAVRNAATSWDTTFTSIGAELDIDEFVLLAQGMSGQTEIAGSFRQVTDFQSAYLLAGHYWGDWRVAGRMDIFGTQQPSEHGVSGTASISWAPTRWLRLASEFMQIHSYRSARTQESLAQTIDDTQLQLMGRFFF